MEALAVQALLLILARAVRRAGRASLDMAAA